jgi:hypothetical protein
MDDEESGDEDGASEACERYIMADRQDRRGHTVIDCFFLPDSVSRMMRGIMNQ